VSGADPTVAEAAATPDPAVAAAVGAAGPAAPPRSRATALPRGLLILLGLAAATVAVGGMKALSGIIAPTAMGIVLVLTVAPARGWVERRGAPAWAAALSTIVLVYAILVGMILALVVSMAQLAEIVPQYSDQFVQLVKDFGAWLQSLGIQAQQVDDAAQSLDPKALLPLIGAIAGGVIGVVTLVVFIATLVLFIGFDATKFPGTLSQAKDERPQFVEALGAFAHGTRKYMTVSAAFGLIVAVIDVVALWLLGIPGALVWGVLSFVTNFIPNIGFVIGVIPPAILGLLEGGPSLMLAVILLYSVINFVIQSIIQPKYQGDVLGLSTTLTFLSLIFWAWVLGPLGAILALPLTLLAKALLVDVDPNTRWLGPMLSGAPLVEAPSLAAPAAED
jgi:AI-2 transport protein TqsA